MDALAYELSSVRYAYAGSRSPFVLDIDSLRIDPGGILALVGPNGAGKSTLLHLLGFLVRPAGGRLDFFGQDPWRDPASSTAARRETALVTHHPYLFKGTVFDNLAFGLKVRGIPKGDWRERVREALTLVELAGLEKRSAAGLSAGQAQRVALARALVLRPRVLLLDEPTATIEAGLALRVEAVIGEISRAAETTVVFSTHNFSQASRLAGEILYLSDGKRVRFSHENCFSGMAATDGRESWIEPRPGVRIRFRGAYRGHVTCVINPEAIRLAAPGGTAAAGSNVFSGRVTRLETTDPDQALVRVSGPLTFRATVPLREVGPGGVSLSREVLLEFSPGSVEVIASENPETPHD